MSLAEATIVAEPPQRWVCSACGKTSATRYGFDRTGKSVSDYGWDASCMLHAVLCEPNPEAPPKWRAVLETADAE